MELKQIKELMAAMEKAGMKKLTIKEKSGFEVHLERQDEKEHIHVDTTAALFSHPAFRAHEAHSTAHFPVSQTPPAIAAPSKEPAAAAPAVEGKFVTSPMVGTFYRTPSPEDPPFVKVGDKVDENTVICIIEAMKVMNEVKAGISGVVAEICLDNGTAVEFGSKLFRVV